MATVINNPGSNDNTGSGMGLVIGAIILLVVLFVFFMYGLPAMRGASRGTNIQVPDKVQVDVNANKQSN